MSHEISITEGQAEFVSARTPAWHRLGTVVDHAMTAEEVLRLSHLANWDVRKTPLSTTVLDLDGVTTLDVPEQFATVRTNPITGKPQVLGVVGSRFEPIQNEDTTELLNILVDESGAHFETAGGLYDGKQAFVTMKMPNAMSLATADGVDSTDLYIAALNSHDGQTSMRIIVTPIRIVCKNTQTLALNNALSSFSIRHTSGFRDTIAEARRALKLVWKYNAEFEAQMQQLIDQPFSHERSNIVLKQVFNVDDVAKLSKREISTRMDHVDACMSLLDSSTNANVAGTKYATLNAVTEHVDWTWGVRGKERDESQARALRMIQPSFVKLKTRAFELVSAAN